MALFLSFLLLFTVSCQPKLPQPVLLHAYSETCRSCMDELPDFEAFGKQLPPSLPVYLLALSPKPKPQYFPILTDASLASHWGLFKVPETILIDASGRVAKKWIGPQKWMDSVVKDSIFKSF